MSSDPDLHHTSVREPNVVLRLTDERYGKGFAADIHCRVLEQFGDFVEGTIDTLLQYHRLQRDHGIENPLMFRRAVMKRADILNPLIQFYYTLSLASCHPARLRDEIAEVLSGYGLLFSRNALLPFGGGEGLKVDLIPISYLRRFNWLAPQHDEIDPRPDDFADGDGNLRLWAEVGAAEVQVSVPWNDTLRLLFGQVGLGVLSQLGSPSELSGKREILRWLRANHDIWAILISTATKLQIGLWPALLQARFIQDAMFAAEASILHSIAHEETILNSTFTPCVVRTYVLGRFPTIFAMVPPAAQAHVNRQLWWRFEMEQNFDTGRAFAQRILDKYYGARLLETALVAPRWKRQPGILSVELYLLYICDPITSYLIQCLMAHLKPTTMMMHRITDLLHELLVLLDRNSLNLPIPVPFNLLPVDDIPLDLLVGCDSTQEVGRKARNTMDAAAWTRALRSIVTDRSRQYQKDPVQWIRWFCAAIVQTVLHIVYTVVPTRFEELAYLLSYPPLIPRRIREQCRDLYGNTSVHSYHALANFITSAAQSFTTLGKQDPREQTSSTGSNVGGAWRADVASHGRSGQATEESTSQHGDMMQG
ncbi:hypothetical protein CALCODRAFT_538839, partial [Calocera cornea HHB12733]